MSVMKSRRTMEDSLLTILLRVIKWLLNDWSIIGWSATQGGLIGIGADGAGFPTTADYSWPPMRLDQHRVVPVGGAVTTVFIAGPGQGGVASAVTSRPVARSSATVRAMSTMRSARTAGRDDASAQYLASGLEGVDMADSLGGDGLACTDATGGPGRRHQGSP
jgi:hypothetical protein